MGLPLHSENRIWIFFSWLCDVGHGGIERTKILAVAIASMSITNIFLSRVLVFGKFGLEPMGIRGAAWASNIAEVVSLAVFLRIVVSTIDSKTQIFHFKAFSRQLFSQILDVSATSFKRLSP